MRSWTICLAINLFVALRVNGQNNLNASKSLALSHARANSYKAINADSAKWLFLVAPKKILTDNYYYNSIGFFCQKELQLEKAIRLPVRIRLGSVTYTDKMEGKGQSPSFKR
jgi:hypothetical protein